MFIEVSAINILPYVCFILRVVVSLVHEIMSHSAEAGRGHLGSRGKLRSHCRVVGHSTYPAYGEIDLPLFAMYVSKL